MQDAFAYCADLVRSNDRDRYIATLFAPAECRNALYALYAFNAEIARVRDVAREPLPGEIRLQWWVDVLSGERDGEASANPVASALLDTIQRYKLGTVLLTALIDAHRFDLYDEPMEDLGKLEIYARETSSALITLAARILTGSELGDLLQSRRYRPGSHCHSTIVSAPRQAKATFRPGRPACASRCERCTTFLPGARPPA